MNFLEFLYDTLVLFVGSDFFSSWFPFLIAFFFVGFVPKFIRSLFVWR